MSKPEIYAIDYGTSNSLLNGASKNQIFSDVPIDPKSDEPSILKSIIYAADNKDWIFGANAIGQYIENPAHGRIFKSLKRFLPDPSFKGTTVHNQFMSVADLVAKQLRYMRENANEHFGVDVRRVVMGCPAVFSENEEANQCAFDRLELASKAAGFDEIEFCPEPIAAAYRFRSQLSEEKMVAVADFGGGTSDFTILKMGPERFQQKDVLALGGVSIAGDKYDSAIMKDIVSPHFGSEITYRRPMSKNQLSFPKALVRKMCSPADMVMLNRSTVLDYLKEAQRFISNDDDAYKIDQLLVLIEDRQGYALFKEIEEAKISLSENELVPLEYHYPMSDVGESVEKKQFEDASADFTHRILRCLDETLVKAGLESQDIDIVCLTGGTSHIPSLRLGLEQRFGDKLQLSKQFHSVAHGLADRAQSLL